MKVIIFQENKKISIEFHHKGIVDKFVIDKADEFLECIDKLAGKNRMEFKALQNVRLEFRSAGLLTERIIRVIMLGLCFDKKLLPFCHPAGDPPNGGNIQF